MNILEVKNLDMNYETLEGNVSAVKNVSFSVKQGESFGIVGESGCGKTSVAMSLLQLQADNGKITNGEILFNGKDKKEDWSTSKMEVHSLAELKERSGIETSIF